MIKLLTTFLRKDPLLRQGLVDTNYYFLAQTGAKVITLLVLPVFARLLSLEQFAAYDLFVLSSGFLVLVASLGMDSGLAIKIAETREDNELLSALLTTTIGVSSFLIIVLWIGGIVVLSINPAIASISPLFINGLFLYTLIYQYNYNIYNFARWLGNARAAALINFTSSVLGIIGGMISLLAFEREVEYYVMGAIVGNLGGAVLSTLNARKYLVLRKLPPSHLKDLMRLSLPYLPTYFSTYLMQLTDRLIITSVFGLSGLGLYAFVNRIAQVPNFGLQIVANGFRPIIYSNYKRQEGRRLANRIFNFFWIMMVPATLISVFAASPIILFLGGDQYENAKDILPYIVVSVLFLGSFYLFGFGYSIKRKTLYVTWISLGVVLGIYLLSFPLIKLSGMLGVAQASVIVSLIGAFVYILLSEKLCPFKYNYKLMFVSVILCIVILLVLKP